MFHSLSLWQQTLISTNFPLLNAQVREQCDVKCNYFFFYELLFYDLISSSESVSQCFNNLLILMKLFSTSLLRLSHVTFQYHYRVLNATRHPNTKYRHQPIDSIIQIFRVSNANDNDIALKLCKECLSDKLTKSNL